MKRLLLLFITNLLPLFLLAQITLSGKVTNAATNEPIEFANVFLAKTTLGTTTDAAGYFQLENVPEGIIQMVCSFVGFESVIANLDTEQLPTEGWHFQLEPISFDLSTVQITAAKNNKRKRYLKQFEKAFFGYSKHAAKCTLLNPEVLQFEQKGDNHWTATALDLLEIENQALGYKLFFLLESFEKSAQTVQYQGKPLFELIPSTDKKANEKWARNREETYKGSIWHFYNALSANQLRKEGFEIETARLHGNTNFVSLGKVGIGKVLAQAETSQTFLTLEDFLQVTYTKEVDQLSFKVQGNLGNATADLGRPAEADMINQGKGEVGKATNFQTSWLFARKAQVELNAFGFPKEPELVLEYGYWSYEGIADLLPMEYMQSFFLKKRQAPKRNLQEKNGFILDNLSIPIKEIKSGNVPKDGIPSIDQPEFLAASEVHFLTNRDWVLGVNWQGIQKAYPIRILNYHEVVNDQFEKYSVAVTYCPLCGSGMVFQVEKGQVFGVSGLLYNSDVLLYDRQTASLWSQILGEAISGVAAGQVLKSIPSQLTTWEKWRTKFPNTQVLNIPVGSDRDYTTSPYLRYETSSQPIFPLTARHDQLPPKEKVLGVELSGIFKAYPFSQLAKTTGQLQETINGQSFTIFFDKKSKVATLETEQEKPIIATTMYWFAWYAFHPDTEVFRR